MGVADNKSYKNQYHFNARSYEVNENNLPSIKGENKINTTIKENPYRSNVEIEKDEIVLKPDLSALFKAHGKKHADGGMDVQLDPNSFIFSDDKTLALGERDHKLFELKKGGSFAKTKNTPADVLKRNVDIKHYNTLIANLDDPFKDDLAKKSSAMMLEKYIQTIGNIAYIQEEKKGLPDGIPDFSMGTAPVYDGELKDEIMQQKQYAKYGGRILQRGAWLAKDKIAARNKASQIAPWQIQNFTASDPNLIKTGYMVENNPLVAGDNIDMLGGDGTNQGRIPSPAQAPTGNANWGLWKGDKLPAFQDRYGTTNAADKITDLGALAEQVGYTGPKDNKSFQQWLYNSSPENKAIIDKWHNTYNVGPNAGMFDGKIGIRWQNALREISNPRTTSVGQPQTPNTAWTPPTATARNIVGAPGPSVPDITGDPQGVKRADWQFTPWQKVSQLYNLGKYASVQRYMPFRSRYNASYMDPQLVNPEQTLSDLRAGANQQIGALNTLNPILRNAQAAGAYGQYLDQAPQVRSQYDNQNVQIANQARQYNNQIRNQESMTNMKNDQDYYQQSVIGRQNFNNMRSFAADQYMNNLLGDAQTNESLALNMLTQNNPAYNYDFKTGNFTRTNKSIMDVQTDTKADAYTQYITGLIEKQKRGETLSKAEVDLAKAMSIGKIPFTPGLKKKGGKFNPYK